MCLVYSGLNSICKFCFSLNSLVCYVALACLSVSVSAQVSPVLQLANVYHADIKIEKYWVSEKLDGVRAYWDGARFLSKNGNVYNAPGWFIQNMPRYALDGELWISRNTFNELSGVVRKKRPIDSEWRKVSYQVFDLPEHSAIFDHRLKLLNKLFGVKSGGNIQADTVMPPWVNVVKQFKVNSQTELMDQLDRVVKQGGEGLMLHLGDSYYHGRRDDDLLKLKQHLDAEARVIKHYPGKGKYKGLLGAMLVETLGQMGEEIKFRIGTGFSDQERKNPPIVGTVITYKYFGYTQSGLPKFPSYLRIRGD